jgi:hypothetical protein
VGIQARSFGGARLQVVPYELVLDVRVQVSPHQYQRGTGTLRVLYRVSADEPAPRELVLPDVPEPERLAQWLRTHPRVSLQEPP